MAQPKRKTESRRAARRQAGRRVPVSNVAGRLVIMLALVAAVVFGAQARCVLAGRNWNMWRHQKNNKNKARRNKK